PDPSQAPMKAVLFASITVLFYVVFVIIQTVRHRAFFAEPSHSDRKKGEHDATARRQWAELACLSRHDAPAHPPSNRAPRALPRHHRRFRYQGLGLPAPLGGIMIAVLVLSPEGLTAFHAALVNHLQRAVNVCLGSVLATIGLTIPAVLTIGLITGHEVHLGLD